MKYTVENSLANFPFWSGAKTNAAQLTYSELEDLEPYIEDALGEEVTETDINDLFWFDFETVVSFLGYRLNDAGDIIRDEDEDDDEEEEDDDDEEEEDTDDDEA